MAPGVLQGGVSQLPKGGYVSIFTRFAENRKLNRVQEELERLKRDFLQLQQEWDAVQDRVSKVLRRMARAEQADVKAEGPGPEVPLTNPPTSTDRMTRLRQQLAARGKAGE